MTKSDFVRRPGHNGKPGSRSRGAPASLPCEKKETDAGEFPPKDWPNKYVADEPIYQPCINPECKSQGKKVYHYYTLEGEGFNSILRCSCCHHISKEET